VADRHAKYRLETDASHLLRPELFVRPRVERRLERVTADGHLLSANDDADLDLALCAICWMAWLDKVQGPVKGVL
jgi:hypothetical protein